MSLSRIPYRWLIPFAAFIALLVGQVKGCSVCEDLSLTLLGELYFGALTLLALIFSLKRFAAFGFGFAVILAISLMSYAHDFCLTCYVAHSCHILFWMTFLMGGSPVLVTCALVALMPFLPRDDVKIGLRPEFSFVTEQGTRVTPENVILHFIKSDCPYCQEQMDELEQLARKRPNLLIINISKLPVEKACDLQCYVDESGELFRQFGVNVYPTLIVINQYGQISKVLRGQFDNLPIMISLIPE